jgi:ATP-dependent DNA helicase RecG
VTTKTKTSTFGLKGVGDKIAKMLARLDIHSPQDLLFHFPSRYQDRTQIQSIRQLLPDAEAVIEGVITHISQPQRGRTKLLCELKDETGKIMLRFFHLMPYQKDTLVIGARLRCYSQVRLGVKGLEMFHPEFKIITPEKHIPIESHLTPIYPATEGLSQYMLRKLAGNALDWMSQSSIFNDLLPLSLLQSLAFPSFKEALQFIHHPPSDVSISQLETYATLAQKRLIFEELLVHRVSLLTLKENFKTQKSLSLVENHELQKAFRQQLAFQLTTAQERVIKEVQADLAKTQPMLRLVQGDVGSGKTVVAAYAMLNAIGNHYQAVMMAPTELLAEQHYRNFKKWFDPLNINVVFLSGNVKGAARAKVLNQIESGEAQIILGTHALFQEHVKFAKLALVIIDEQHRFGVQQRALLREKGMQADFYPHQLLMTATPIPRTLAMSFYADLDSSSIDELPPGRTPITTTVMAASRRDEIISRIQQACAAGRQVYWVCPLIEESESLNCEAATAVAATLQEALSPLVIGLVHGRMRASEKETVMQAFKQGEIHVLVATTVIEVGVDVPNASVMIIENAERLGLSQLHQLRGRVGRGSIASHCVLLYQHPISQIGKERLQVMRETTDGFKIAERDLQLRGPGEVLGTRQTGDLAFRVADLLRDSHLLPEVQRVAEIIMRDHADVIPALMKRWLAQKQEYGKV